MKKVKAVYRCRHCGEVYQFGEYPADNLAATWAPTGLYDGERMLPALSVAAMVDIHTCDACVPKFGVADLVGWE